MNFDSTNASTENSLDGDDESSKNKLLRLLDEMEQDVEEYRRQAMNMQEKRHSLFVRLNAIGSSDLMNDLSGMDQEEILEFRDRVICRYSSVELTVHTVRDQGQEESLRQVNRRIDDLINRLPVNGIQAKRICSSYLAACGSRCHENVDREFEVLVLGCALDDQKTVRKRLEALFEYSQNTRSGA